MEDHNLKLLHVVTLHSSDNAFGGPVRVALNLATELKKHGNDVKLLAGSRGLPQIDFIEGIPCHLFPVHNLNSHLGFSGLFSWKLWVWAWRNVKIFDVVHVHLARDLITLPVALIALVRGVPFVIQTHGMIDSTQKVLGRVLDVLATRRLMRRAARILYLTSYEEGNLKEVSRNRHATMSFFPNGVPESSIADVQQATFISFISRLQKRKHPELFVQMASILDREHQEFEFRIAGPDEGELEQTLEAMRRTTLGSKIAYLGALNHDGVLELLSKTKVLVLPSVDEIFPMIILEALSVGVPVVITEFCGLAKYIAKGEAGIVTDGTPEKMALAVQIISSDFNRFSMSAKELSASTFSMKHIMDLLNDFYDSAMNGEPKNQSS